MKKFLVLYLVPTDVIDRWTKTPPEDRKAAEDKMRAEWGAWMGAHSDRVKGTEAAGKTKRVSTDGVSDARNDIMLYAFVEAESQEAAAQLFVGHPHLQIPQSSIEIMEVRAMGPSQG
jgi:hypothetical protein